MRLKCALAEVVIYILIHGYVTLNCLELCSYMNLSHFTWNYYIFNKELLTSKIYEA